MIHIVYADEAIIYPRLFATMFKDRAKQFKDRLRWNVSVDDAGRERDEYDYINPIYLISEQPDGTHAGSLRLLPTVGKTMTNTHFADITGGVTIKSPFIWECTRFCLAPDAASSTSREIALAALRFGMQCEIVSFVGVFDQGMEKVYRRIGWSPTIIGEGQTDSGSICAGLWPVTMDALESVQKLQEKSRETSQSCATCLGPTTLNWSSGALRERKEVRSKRAVETRRDSHQMRAG